MWCLPKSTEEQLNELHQSIVQAVSSVEELGLRGEKDITCLFPTDMMAYGLGSGIIVEVTGLFEKPERTLEVRKRLAANLGNAVSERYPKAKVECLIPKFNQEIEAFWTSGR